MSLSIEYFSFHFFRALSFFILPYEATTNASRAMVVARLAEGARPHPRPMSHRIGGVDPANSPLPPSVQLVLLVLDVSRLLGSSLPVRVNISQLTPPLYLQLFGEERTLVLCVVYFRARSMISRRRPGEGRDLRRRMRSYSMRKRRDGRREDASCSREDDPRRGPTGKGRARLSGEERVTKRCGQDEI
jgi:hypothetical protein